MAVFNEVLNISINTAGFQEQLAEIAAMYEEAIGSMPELGSMGAMAAAGDFKAAAAQIALAADSVASNVMQMSADVNAAMEGIGDTVTKAGIADARWGKVVAEGSGAWRARFVIIEQAEREMRTYIATVNAATLADERQGIVLDANSRKRGLQQIAAAGEDVTRAMAVQSTGMKEMSMLNAAYAENTARAALKQTAGMKEMAMLNAAYAENAARSASQGMSSIERFESGFETAMYRIPGRMAVIAGLGVAVALALVPLKMLKDGFEALASSSEDFKKVHTELSNMLSVFEQVAARPIFDAVLESMKQLDAWMEKNRAQIDDFADGLGKVAKAFLGAFSGDTFSVISGLTPVLIALGLVFNDLALTITTSAIALGTFLALMDPRNIGKEADIAKEKIKQLDDAFKAHAQLEDRLTGQAPSAGNLEAGITAKNEKPKAAEMLAQYKLNQQEIRALDQETADHQKVLAETYVITKKKADDEIVASAQIAQEAIQQLGNEFVKSIENLSPADVSQMTSEVRKEVDQIKKGLLGGGGPQSPVTREQNRVRQALIDADRDERADQKAHYSQLEKDTAEHYAIAVKQAKDAADRHRETYIAAFVQEQAAENLRYETQKANITKIPGGAPGTEPERAREAATRANERTHEEFMSAADDKRLDNKIKDVDLTEKTVALENKAKASIIETQIAQAKLIGDKVTEITLGQQKLQQDSQGAQIALEAATKKAALIPDTTTTAGREAAAALVIAQQAAARAQQAALEGEYTQQLRIDSVIQQRYIDETKIDVATAETAKENAKLLGSKTAEAAANERLLKAEQAQLTIEVQRADEAVRFAQTDEARAEAALKLANYQKQLAGVSGQLGLTEGMGPLGVASATATENAKNAMAIAQANSEQAKLTHNKKEELKASLAILDLKIQEQAILVAEKQEAVNRLVNLGPLTADQQKELESARQQLAQAQAPLPNLGIQRQIAATNATPGGQFAESLGVNLGELQAKLASSAPVVEKFADVIQAASQGLVTFGDELAKAYEDFKKGNIGGGVTETTKAAGQIVGGAAEAVSKIGGDAMKGVSDSLSNFSKSIPVIGAAIGSAISMVSQFFSQSIQNMVNDINQQIQNIQLEASTKQIGIMQEIQALKAEEQAAISELGGKKKAQGQLKQILQALDSQIAQLTYQAQQTVQQFNNMVAAANTGTAAGNQVALQWLSTWTQVNQQVEAYVQAGGSLATAAQFLNQTLQQQQQQLTTQLNQGYTTAIQDALQLNTLEQQKVDMMKQEYATEFQMLNADSVERRTASAVQTGVALTNQRNQFALQMQTMNQQIALEQGRVTAEQQVYNINMSIAALQNEQNVLNIAALNQQLLQYQEMQTILRATQGLVFTPSSINPQAGLGGTQAPIPGLPGVAGPTINGGINVTVNGNVTTDNVADLATEIAANISSGRTTFTTTGS